MAAYTLSTLVLLSVAHYSIKIWGKIVNIAEVLLDSFSLRRFSFDSNTRHIFVNPSLILSIFNLQSSAVTGSTELFCI